MCFVQRRHANNPAWLAAATATKAEEANNTSAGDKQHRVIAPALRVFAASTGKLLLEILCRRDIIPPSRHW